MARGRRRHLLFGYQRWRDRQGLDHPAGKQGLPRRRLRQAGAPFAGLQADKRRLDRSRCSQGHALRGQRPCHEEDPRRGRQEEAHEAERRTGLPRPREVHGQGDRSHGFVVDRGNARTHQQLRRRSVLALRGPLRRWSLAQRVQRRASRRVVS